MPNPMIQENWPELLEPGLRSIFFLQVDSIVKASPIPKLFNVTGSQKAVEHNYGVGGIGDVPIYKGTIEYDTFDKGFKTDFTHVEYSLGMAVERRLVDDDLYNIINQRPRLLGYSFARTREKNGANIFNNAFSSSFPGADGQALCSASHPLGPLNANTASNSGVLPLSYDNVIATRKLMRKYVDDRGQLMPIMPDTLIVPPDLEDIAWVILNSTQKPGTANNDGNYAGSLGIKNLIVWDYLMDTNNWFLADSVYAQLHLWWFQRVPLEFAMDPASDYNLVARYRGYERYTLGWDDWRWVYGHSVP